MPRRLYKRKLLRTGLWTGIVATVALATAPAPSSAYAHGYCRDVQATSYLRAVSIHAINVGCRKARRVVRKWLRTGEAPGYWYCTGKQERPGICSLGNGSAPHFRFVTRWTGGE